MSLNWDISRVRNSEELCYLPDSEEPDKFKLNVVTDALIWHTMYIGLGSITEKNAPEFFLRCEMWADAVGDPIYQFTDNGKEGIRLTYQDIISHIGLSTNVIDESKTKFLNKIYNIKKEDVHRRIRLENEQEIKRRADERVQGKVGQTI